MLIRAYLGSGLAVPFWDLVTIWPSNKGAGVSLLPFMHESKIESTREIEDTETGYGDSKVLICMILDGSSTVVSNWQSIIVLQLGGK